MPAKANPRNHRNNPYVFDGLLANVHHSAAGVLWRFRTEATSLLAAVAVIWQLAVAITIVWALITFAALVTAAFLTPLVRRFIVRRAWCVISRHRLQKVFFETRMHTRSGRLSLVMRIHPTQVGERALIWCRAGICFEDFEAHTGEIAAACYAREARIERSKRWAQLVQVNIVRRDTLAAHHVITSSLANKAPAVPPAARNDAA
jgi:phosphate/sulfate permease